MGYRRVFLHKAKGLQNTAVSEYFVFKVVQDPLLILPNLEHGNEVLKQFTAKYTAVICRWSRVCVNDIKPQQRFNRLIAKLLYMSLD